MKTTFCYGMIVAVLLGLLPFTVTAQEKQDRPLTQEEIARDLLSKDRRVIADRLEDISRIPPDERKPVLRSALIATLEDVGHLTQARTRGEAPPLTEWDHELPLMLTDMVIALQDPAAIPALAGVVGYGWGVKKALIEFGRQAMPAVLHVATSPATSDIWTVFESYDTLCMMVLEWGLDSFSTQERAQLKDAVLLYLNEPYDGSPILSWYNPGYALDGVATLAIALEDPDLSRRLEILSTDTDALKVLHFDDPYTVSFQYALTNLLTGQTPLPEYARRIQADNAQRK